jgi:hypothetical protein
MDALHPVRFRGSSGLRFHWPGNHPTDASAMFSDPAPEDESARPRDRLFGSGQSTVGGLPQRVVLLHVAYPISTGVINLGSPSNPLGVQVLAPVPQITIYNEMIRNPSWLPHHYCAHAERAAINR